MVILMAIYSILGFAAHYIRDITTGQMSRDWEDVCNKVLGVLYVFPLSLLMYRHLKKDIKKDDLRFLIAYFLSFMSFGVGVIVGFWYKPTTREDR